MGDQAVAALPPSGAGRDPVFMTTATLTNAPPQAGITLRGITKTFRGSKGPVRAVRGVNLDITPGETVALLGPNGAGKSTTIDMMLGLLPPDDGEVTLFGMDADGGRRGRRGRRDAPDRRPDHATSRSARS